MSKAIVVTGAAGYIGSVLCKMLKEQGYHVIGVDNARDHIDHARIVKAKKYCDFYHACDFIDDDFLDKNVLPDIPVVHLAANSLLGPSALMPEEYFFNNTVKTFKLVEFMIKRGCKKLIFASTAAVYSEKQIRKSVWKGLFGQDDLEQMQYPVKETDIISPPNNYGLSKLMSEQMIDAITKAQNSQHEVYWNCPSPLQVFSFRFFNVVGGYGELGPRIDTPHITSQLIKSYQKDEIFFLNGGEFKTKDGSCIRDYVHVMDICRAIMHALVWDESTKRHLKFNLGTGKGYSNKEVIAAFNKVVSPHLDRPAVKVKQTAPRLGDPPYLVADPKLFIEQTGFTYKYSDNLESMIESAWRSHNV